MSSTVEAPRATAMIEALLARVRTDLCQLLDREITVEDIRTERVTERAAGPGQVHVSFKLCVRGPQGEREGCFLLPLPDALTLAACLMMAPEEELQRARTVQAPDRLTKDALLEIGNFLAGACDAILRDWNESCSIQAAGCQGVRPDVRPALAYSEGEELLLARARLRIGVFEPCELVVLLPEQVAPQTH